VNSSIAAGLILAIGGSVWVLFDARSRDWSRSGYSGYSPVFWAAGTALFAIAFVPAYIFARRRSISRSDAHRLAAGGDRRCPRCAETVRASAEVCRFCQHEFVRQARWYDGWKWGFALLALLVAGAYFAGALDEPLSAVGLNKTTCAKNVFGNRMCGDELVQFCQDNYGPGNHDVCDAALDDAGIDPTRIAASQRSGQRAYARCLERASSVDQVSGCDDKLP